MTNTIAQRIQNNIHISSRGCWEWQGMKDRDGYGTMWISDSGKKKIRFTHRMSYEAHVEPIPNDLEIDHLCLNKACCNPEHLEVVTTQENTRRRDLAHEYDKYCRNGHARTSENTYIAKTGMRSCRICRKLATRAYRERKKLLAGVKPRVKRQVISGGKTHSKSRAIFEGKNSG